MEPTSSHFAVSVMIKAQVHGTFGMFPVFGGTDRAWECPGVGAQPKRVYLDTSGWQPTPPSGEGVLNMP